MSGSTPDQNDQLRRALVSLRDLRTRFEALDASRHEPIAVVGMGCRLPGAPDLDAFWTLLRGGGDAVTETPADRWDVDALFDPAPDHPGTVSTRWGGFLDDLAGFDAAFFGLSPREAAQMDPQQRLVLEVAWEALEHAGQPVDRLAGTATGVFVGVHSHSADYFSLQASDTATLDLYSGTGTSHSVTGGRLSYLLDLHGPSLAVDTACSSSLVAVHLAVQSLRRDECSMAIVGGVNAILDPTFTMVASRMRMMSPTGRCRPFDAGADGFVRAEGCGVVVLRRLRDAIDAGDRVLAVIRGSAINQDGRTNGLTAPNSRSQEAVIRAALDDARTAPSEVGMIEAHGTGTPLGDPIEVEALAAVFGGRAPEQPGCALGSVKANIGHTEGAAGVVALIKTVLCLRAGEVPPLVHFDALNPHIDLAGTPLVVPTALSPLPGPAGARVAGVSSFGWSGTNAHVVVADAPVAGAQPAPDGPARPLLLAFGARHPAALATLARRHREVLVGADAGTAARLCGTAAARRSHPGHRLAVAGRTPEALVEQLDVALATPPDAGVVGRRALTVFVFPGQGSQWPGMGRGLFAEEPAFRAALERCAAAMDPLLGWSLLDRLASGVSDGDDVSVVQPVLFAVQVALAALWEDWGVRPDAVVGHSMGEVAAAHVAGVLTIEDAALVICRRSALLRGIAGRGAMAAVELDVAGATAAIGDLNDRLAVAVVNGPTSTVIAGDPAAIDEVVARLDAADVFARRVKVDVASHSPQVDGLLGQLTSELSAIRPQRASVPFWSTVTDGFEDGSGLDATYWARNLREPVRFGDAVEALIAQDHTRFVELAPHPVLAIAIKEALAAAGAAGTAVASLRRDADEASTMASALGALYTDGLDVDWTRYHGRRTDVVDLPAYPWQRERHWLAPAAARRRSAPGALGAEEPIAGEALDDATYEVEWQLAPPVAVGPLVPGTWLLVAGRGGFAAELAAAVRALHPAVVVADPGADLVAALAGVDRIVHLGAVDVADGIAADGAALDRGIELGVESLLATVRTVGATGHDLPVYAATRGAWAVVDADTATAAAQAAVWGLGRAVAEERPQRWGGLVDLDPRSPATVAAEQLVQAVYGSAAGETEVAWRDGEHYVARLVSRPPAAGRLALRTDATVLVTGGFGAVGRPLADWLVAHGARRIVLLGRTELPERARWADLDPDTPAGRRAAVVRRLESAGVAVHVAALDVGDERALRAFLADFAGEGWPPIRAVFHAAAVFGGELIDDLDTDALRAQLAPKVTGTWTLATALPGVDHLVLFSSIAATLPFPGQAAYAAANAFAESLAESLTAAGRSAVSVAWPYWEGSDDVPVGEVGQRHADGRGFKATARVLTEGVGMRSIETAHGLGLLGRLAAAGRPRTMVAPVDWSAFASARAARVPAVARDLVAGGAPSDARPVLLVQLERSAADDRRGVVEDAIRGLVGEIVKLPPARIDDDQPFGSLGFDSLLAIELRNRLEAATGMGFSATVAWNYPNVRDLAAYVLARLDDEGPLDERPVTAAPNDTGDLGQVASSVLGMTDDDALAALLDGTQP